MQRDQALRRRSARPLAAQLRRLVSVEIVLLLFMIGSMSACNEGYTKRHYAHKWLHGSNGRP
jgi:hypothetical protein